jgi:hypothetical protein
MIPSHSPNQSIPSIRSIPLDVRTTKSVSKSIPLILRLARGHIWVDFISPFGEPSSKCVFIELIGILYFATNCSVMNECDAPESNKTCRHRVDRKRTQHNTRSVLSLFSCHVIHSTTHVIPLTLVDLRICTYIAYLD